MKKGNYLGTEVDETWWKRYRGAGFFARGSGEFWMDETGICFRRLLTGSPLAIAWAEMTGAKLATWHAGQWVLGRPIPKVAFVRDGRHLSAGFCFSRGKDRGDRQWMEELVDDLNLRIAGR